MADLSEDQGGYKRALIFSDISKDITASQLQKILPFYTILQEGHLIACEDGDKPLDENTALLAVPQKTSVHIKVVGPSGALSDVKVFASENSTVEGVKMILTSKNSIDFPLDQALFYDVNGRHLPDPCLLSTAANFANSCCRLICIHSPNPAVLAELSAEWRTVEVADEPTLRLAQQLKSSIGSVLAAWSAGSGGAAGGGLPSPAGGDPAGGGVEAEELLQPSSYAAARQRLPSAALPAVSAAAPPELERVKARFVAAAGGGSACPALGAQAVALLDSVAAALRGTNAELAGRCAAAVDSLGGAVEYLASRAPREHRHAAYAAQIREAERALELHRSIRAGRVEALRGPDNMEEMTRALAATEGVRRRPRAASRLPLDIYPPALLIRFAVPRSPSPAASRYLSACFASRCLIARGPLLEQLLRDPSPSREHPLSSRSAGPRSTQQSSRCIGRELFSQCAIEQAAPVPANRLRAASRIYPPASLAVA